MEGTSRGGERFPHLPQPAAGGGGCPVPAGLCRALPRGPDAE